MVIEIFEITVYFFKWEFKKINKTKNILETEGFGKVLQK